MSSSVPSIPLTSDSTNLGSILRGWRLARAWTLRELADKTGCSTGFLSALENGQKRASAETLARLEDALGLHRDELRVIAHQLDAPPGVRERFVADRQRDAAARKLADVLRSSGGQPGALDRLYSSGVLGSLIAQVAPEAPAASGQPHGARAGAHRAHATDLLLAAAMPAEVPVINSVAAGYPTEFTDLGYPARVADAYIRQPDIRDPDAFAARVVGDSMEPLYREGDIVAFSPAKPVTSGMDCFVRIEPDHETTFKRVYFEPDGEPKGADATTGIIRLQPLNPKYPSRALPREQVAGLYAAVSVTRMVG